MVTVVSLPLDQLHPGDNDRTVFDATALRELADSLADHGLAQPITVRPRAQGGYEIVAGERRTRAAQLLGWATIPAIVRELDDEAAAAIMLVENVQRADLNPLDEARAYAKRMRQFGWSAAQVALFARRSEHHIAARLLLCDLVPAAQQLIATGQLRPSFGELMAPLDANRQALALHWLTGQDAPLLRQFRVVCGQLLADQAQEQLFSLDAFLATAAQAASQDDATIQAQRVSPVPPAADLPPFTRCGTLGASMLAYLATLQRAEQHAAAAVVATIYDGMLRSGLCHPPRTTV